MRKILSIVMLTALLAAGGYWITQTPHVAQAQTSLTSTNLAAAVSLTARTMSVASATGFTASTNSATYYAFMDFELVRITSVSGTTIGIERGVSATDAAPHNNTALVWVGPAAAFTFRDPLPGTCTAANAPYGYSPVINTRNGKIWECTSNTTATAASVTDGTAAAPVRNWQQMVLLGVGESMPYRTVVNAAYTARYTDYFIDYTSVSAARTVTLPAVTNIFGKVYIVKNSAGTAGPGITVAASSGQYVTTIGTTTTVVPWGGIVRLISTGEGWATW